MAVYFDSNPHCTEAIQISGFSGSARKIWVTYSQWFSPITVGEGEKSPNLPPELAERINKYKEYAHSLKFNPIYHVKYPSIKFIYKNAVYELTASALGVNNERFEEASGYIEKDLREMGADYTSYMGMID